MSAMPGQMLIGVFEDEDHLIKATNAAREAGFEIVDVFAPYAVHGIDRAMGLPASRLPWVTFWLGLFGAVTMTFFQFWASAVSWPINIGGKPWNSLPAFVPVIFEVTVLCGGVGTVLFFVWWSGLRPGLQSALSDLGVTNDRFALVLNQSGATFNRKAADALLSRFQAIAIQERDISAVPAARVA